MLRGGCAEVTIFSYPRLAIAGTDVGRGQACSCSRKLRGKIFDFPKVELPLFETIPPNEVSITAMSDADFRFRVACPAPMVREDFNKHLWDFYLTLFGDPRGSAGGPFRPRPRSPAFVG